MQRHDLALYDASRTQLRQDFREMTQRCAHVWPDNVAGMVAKLDSVFTGVLPVQSPAILRLNTATPLTH
jgi:hypothetical protein